MVQKPVALTRRAAPAGCWFCASSCLIAARCCAPRLRVTRARCCVTAASCCLIAGPCCAPRLRVAAASSCLRASSCCFVAACCCALLACIAAASCCFHAASCGFVGARCCTLRVCVAAAICEDPRGSDHAARCRSFAPCRRVAAGSFLATGVLHHLGRARRGRAARRKGIGKRSGNPGSRAWVG